MESSLFPLLARQVLAVVASEVLHTLGFEDMSTTYASGSLKGADEGSHSGASSDGHGERAGLDTSSESSSATTSGSVSPVVGL